MAYKERNGSIPRRKSCRACAKAKRRCDLHLPICSRCSQRRLSCEYPLLMEASLPLPLPSNFNFFNSDNNFFVPHPITTLYQQPPPPTPPLLPSSYRSPHKAQADSPLSLKPLFSTAMVRLHFLLNMFQNAHRTMVLENQTPWSHPLLWQNGMPRSMQGTLHSLPIHIKCCDFLYVLICKKTDAYACCSLYMNRNASNSKMILSIIENRVADLLASEQPNSATECLARLQALILYQTIRLFDDDTSARVAADLTMPVLQSSLTYFLENIHLEDTLTHLNNLPINLLIEEPSPSSSSFNSKDHWQSWIFEESARRTMFLSHLLIRIWEILRFLSNEDEKNNKTAKHGKDHGNKKQLTCDGRLGLTHCWWYWYLSSHLWEAQTRYEFALAYTEKNRFMIRDLDFTEFLELGSPDDVDMLSKMVLSVLMGKEALQEWFLERGSNLVL